MKPDRIVCSQIEIEIVAGEGFFARTQQTAHILAGSVGSGFGAAAAMGENDRTRTCRRCFAQYLFGLEMKISILNIVEAYLDQIGLCGGAPYRSDRVRPVG